MKKRLLLILFMLSICLSLLAQEENDVEILAIDQQKREVKEIDSQILYKSEPPAKDEWWHTVYFDKDNKVRKVITNWSYPEDNGYYYRYFNKEGVAIHTLYASFGEMNGRFSVTRYLHNNANLLYVDFLIREDYEIPQLVEHIKRYSPYEGSIPMPMPVEYSGSSSDSYDPVTHLDSLSSPNHSFLGNISLTPSKGNVPVMFNSPQVGDTTFVNNNDVEVHREANTTYYPINKLYVGDQVIVLGQENDWYKICTYDWNPSDSIVGYVRKEYLASVEKKATSKQMLSLAVKDQLRFCKSEVEEINKLELCKRLVTHRGAEVTKNLPITDYEKATENVHSFYYDANNKIRKCITLSNHPEMKGFSIHYFDEVGYLLHTINYESSAMNNSVIGTSYWLSGKPVYTDVQYKGETNEIAKTIKGNGLKVDNHQVFNIHHTDDLIEQVRQKYGKTLPIEQIECSAVVFEKPREGQKTIVNGNSVNIREEASTDSKVIASGGIFTDYKIVEVTWEGGEWYHVIYDTDKDGYIHADYIETIEKPHAKE